MRGVNFSLKNIIPERAPKTETKLNIMEVLAEVVYFWAVFWIIYATMVQNKIRYKRLKTALMLILSGKVSRKKAKKELMRAIPPI